MFYRVCISLLMFIPFLEVLAAIPKRDKKWYVYLLLLLPIGFCFLFQFKLFDVNIYLGKFVWNINIPLALTVIAGTYMIFFTLETKNKLSWQSPLILASFYGTDLTIKIIYSLLSVTSFNSFNEFYNDASTKYFFILSYVLISFTISFAFTSFRRNNRYSSLSKIIIVALMIIGSFSLAIIQNLFIALLGESLENEFNSLFAVTLIITFITILILIVYELDNRNKIAQNKYLQLKSNLDTYYDKQMLLNQEELIKLKHDMNNFLEVVKIKDEEMYDDLKDRIGSATMFNFCEDEILNKILVLKAAEATKEGITFNVDVSDKEEITMLNVDKISLFANILDNAIEGAKNSKNKVISIDIHYTDMYLNMHINNSCDELIRKTDSVYHGKGMEIISTIINKYNGKINTIYANGIYSLTIDLDLAKRTKK